MKIAQATIEMCSTHASSSEYEVQFDAESSFRTVFGQVSEAIALPESKNNEQQAQLLLMLQTLIARMLDLIIGKQDSSVTDLRGVMKAEGAAGQESSSDWPRKIVEMSWKSERIERIHEQESTCFSSTGKITTVDGCSLDFKLDLTMNRNFECERKMTEAGQAVLRDPLVINFDGKAAELSGKRIAFDLDADGQAETIARLGSSSGYLAIDRNADGRVNDGSELFGTRSGNGFDDLARLDNDGNHWLDENDAAYDSLRIWRQTAAGQDSLTTLREAGVGALYLGSTETPFDLTDDENKMLGHIRASGAYLTERGGVGSLQQIDLAI